MNMFDEARAMSGTLKLCNVTQKELAEKMGVSQSYVANKLRLLTLGKRAREKVLENGLSERHARTLLRLKDEVLVLEVIEKISKMHLTVYETECLVDGMVADALPEKIKTAPKSELIETFEGILRIAMENLARGGIRVKKSESFYGPKKYITLSFEEN